MNRIKTLFAKDNWAIAVILGSVFFTTVYLSLFINFVNCIYNNDISTIWNSGFDSQAVLNLLLSGFVLLISAAVIYYVLQIFGKVIYRYRWPILIIAAVIASLFHISGSSLGMWSFLISDNSSQVLWGVPRSLRSDEFCVSTLFQLSQTHNNFSAISEFLRGDLTDVRLVYGATSWSLITLFRPLSWGYLILGFDFGMAFFWNMRLALMLLVSFDCFYIFSKSRTLASFFACFLCFSPLIQWWGTGECVLYGQALVVAFDKALFAPSKTYRRLCLVIIAWLCGCYIMLMYPAWMVPFFYIFAVMGCIRLCEFVKSLKVENEKLLPWDIFDSILTCVLCIIIGVLIAICFLQSSNVMELVSNTVYPGARFETGGSGSFDLPCFLPALFYAIDEPGVSNACEISTIVCFFPLGIVFTAVNILLSKKVTNLALLILQVIFIIFIYFGFPPLLARITLMSNVPVGRLLFPVGYLELFLFLSSICRLALLAKSDRKIRHVLSVLIVVSFCALFISNVYLKSFTDPGYLRKAYIFLIFIFLLVFSLIFCRYVSGTSNSSVSLVAILLLIVAPGMCINPIQVGSAPVTDTDLARLVEDNKDDDLQNKWVVDGSWTVANLCAAYGVPVINSTNAYPDLSRWSLLDSEHDYVDVYNRYAHIVVNVGEKTSGFKLVQDDLFNLDLSSDGLKRLGIRYVLSSRELSSEILSGIDCVFLGSANGFNLYFLDY